MARFFASLAVFLCVSAALHADDMLTFDEVPGPAGHNAREPSLFVTEDGRLLMSWIEAGGESVAVKVAVREGGNWGTTKTVTASRDLFVNWADFPSVAAFGDGTLIAHWLQRSGLSGYAYDIKIALSHDGGETWSAPITPHRDGTSSQHGFVSLLPTENDVVAVWLDGRAYDGDLVEPGALRGKMQLRTTVISPSGTATADVALDFATCSCCQTAAAMSGGDLLVVYRDRNENEIRDISIVRLNGGRWSAPSSVHHDNWQLSGCPVNGPSIAAHGQRVVVAWFTGADDVPAVNITTSEDGGRSFGDAVRIDQGEPIGRVDTLMLQDGSALISWVEWTGRDEVLVVCRAISSGCTATRRVAANSAGGSVNFPQLAATPEGVFLAWTQPLPDGSDTIRILKSSH